MLDAENWAYVGKGSTYNQEAIKVRNTIIEVQRSEAQISVFIIAIRKESGAAEVSCGATLGPATPLSECCGREEEEGNEDSEKVDEMHLVDVDLCFGM